MAARAIENWQIIRLIERLKNARLLQFQLFAVVIDAATDQKLVYRLTQSGAISRVMDEIALEKWMTIHADYGLAGYRDAKGLVCFVMSDFYSTEQIKAVVNQINGIILEPNCTRDELR